MAETENEGACGAPLSNAELGGPVWESFRHRYRNQARPEELEIYPNLKQAWNEWQAAWAAAAKAENLTLMKTMTGVFDAVGDPAVFRGALASAIEKLETHNASNEGPALAAAPID